MWKKEAIVAKPQTAERLAVEEVEAVGTLSSPPAGGATALVAAALVAASAVAFSGKAVVAKLMYRAGADPVTTLALRMAFAAPVYVAVAVVAGRGARRLTRREIMAIVGLGLVGYYGSSTLDFVGLSYVSAGLERLILFTYPTIVVLLSALLLGERVRRHQVFALSVTYVGIGVALGSELDLNGAHVAFGAALIFGGSLLYAGYMVGSTRLIRRLGSERFTAWALLCSTAAVLGHAAASGVSLFHHSAEVYGLGLLMGLGCTVFPTFALAEGIRRLGPGPAAIIGTVGPVSTLFLAHWLLGEPILGSQLVGTALVLVGATAVARSSARGARTALADRSSRRSSAKDAKHAVD